MAGQCSSPRTRLDDFLLYVVGPAIFSPSLSSIDFVPSTWTFPPSLCHAKPFEVIQYIRRMPRAEE